MTRVVCDEVVKLELDSMQEQIEIRDKSGRILGRFVPEAVYAQLTAAMAEAEFTSEELDRAEKQPGGRTTTEVLKRLQVR